MKAISRFLLTLAITSTILHGCGSTPTTIPISEKSNNELIEFLETFKESNNDITPYSFRETIDELKRRGSLASETAPTLARAIAFDRRDSVIASEALIAIGTRAKSAIPYLVQNMNSSRADVRLFSTFVLGIIGEPSNCAVPQIASLLWDTDPFVRSTSAGALTEITNNNLLEFDDLRLNPSTPGSVNADTPDGSITGIAREWWLNSCQSVIWPTENCMLPQ